MPKDTFPEINSLSWRQVSLLTRTLEKHRELLQAGHEDARRAALLGSRPAYVVDFQLIEGYVFPMDGPPEWNVELGYLFGLGQTTFVIGPGTQVEIARFLESLGFYQDEDGLVHQVKPKWRPGRSSGAAAEDATALALDRLSHLLSQSNFVTYDELVGDSTAELDGDGFDQDAYRTALAILEGTPLRRKASSSANRADALNWATVIQLRRDPARDRQIYPYLLTATRPLLDETLWSDASRSPVSRAPAEAIFSEVLLASFARPAEAADHTVEMAFETARLERDLRKSPAYRDPDKFSEEADWERALEHDRISPRLRGELSEMARFTTDPIVIETQRIYSAASLTASSTFQQRGISSESSILESPQRLFDLINGINAALVATAGGPSPMADLWKSLLEVEEKTATGYLSYSVVDRVRNDETYSYLVAEVHSPQTSDTDDDASLIVSRWRSSLDGEAILATFSDAFSQANAETVDVLVGTPMGVAEFDADIPLTLLEIVSACEKAGAFGRSEVGVPAINWVRLAAPPFELFAELTARPPRTPLIGVFASRFDEPRLGDLFRRTSGRYLFAAWLERALEDIERRTMQDRVVA
ncbi:MAG TPA: hypothetical protein VIM33_14135 [Gaiellaceae bacterium]